jgi:hypothetical protein
VAPATEAESAAAELSTTTTTSTVALHALGCGGDNAVASSGAASECDNGSICNDDNGSIRNDVVTSDVGTSSSHSDGTICGKVNDDTPLRAAAAPVRDQQPHSELFKAFPESSEGSALPLCRRPEPPSKGSVLTLTPLHDPR